MELPIYIDGQQEGTLTWEQQGAATVMRADMRDVGRLVRLTVYGEKEGYLGVPEPQNGRLRLTRRFSPMDMRRFPQRPEYAGERPRGAAAATPRPAPADAPPAANGDAPRRHVLWMGGRPYFF